MGYYEKNISGQQTSLHYDRWISKLSKADSFFTSMQKRNKMAVDIDVNVSVQTIRRRLNEYELNGKKKKKNY